MSTNLSRESRFASVLWVEGAPYTLQQLAQMCDMIDNEEDPAAKRKLIREYKEATLANSDYMESFFGAYFTVRENAITVCHDHFGLPNFQEILKYIWLK